MARISISIPFWDRPYSGGWIGWEIENLRRFDWGRERRRHGWTYWWAIGGFFGYVTIRRWPWQRIPDDRPPMEKRNG